MAQGLTRKEIKHDEVLEAAQDLGDWLEVHWKRVLIALAAGFGTLVLVLGWQGLQDRRDQAANELLGEGQTILRNVGDPLTGAGATYADAIAKLDEAAAKAGASHIGDVARYYGGVARLRSGDAAAAAERLEELARDGRDDLIRQNSRISLSAAYAAQGRLADADRVLREAAADPSAVFPADQALLTLAGLHRDAGEVEAAERVLREIVERYPATQGAQEARALLSQ